MKKDWTITKLITAGTLGIVYLILILPGVGIVAMTGIPGMGGIINIFVACLLFSLCCLIIRKFGAATIMGFVCTAFAISIPYFGPPGFLPKVIIGLGMGLIADFTYFLLKRREKIATMAIGGFVALCGSFLLLGLGLLFSIPGIEKLVDLYLRPISIAATFVYGTFAGYVGYLIYKKLRNTSVVRRIQA